MRDLYGGTGTRRPSNAPQVITGLLVVGIILILIYFIGSWLFGEGDIANKTGDELYEAGNYKAAMEKYKAKGTDDPKNVINIAWCQIASFIKALHERRAVG